jgi:hypothetical protein
MAVLSLRALLAGVLIAAPSVVAAYANSTFSNVDMLRAQLALMDNRPKDCPPWYAILDHIATILHTNANVAL